MKGKKGKKGKQAGEPRKLEGCPNHDRGYDAKPQFNMDPEMVGKKLDGPYQEEVQSLLSKHWQIEEHALCIKEQGHLMKYQVKAPSGELLFVQAYAIENPEPLPNQTNYYKLADKKAQEERNMKFMDFLTEQKVGCSQFVSPGVANSDRILICVQKVAPGAHITMEHLHSKEAIEAIGRHLADTHQASRNFKTKNPEVCAGFPEWNSENRAENNWAGYELQMPTELEQSDLHYGLCDTEWHMNSFNIHLEESKENSYQVTKLYFHQMKKCWYLVDVGTIIYECFWRIADNHVLNKQANPPLPEQQQLSDWLSGAYEKRTHEHGWTDFKINQEHLKLCIDVRRDRMCYTEE